MTKSGMLRGAGAFIATIPTARRTSTWMRLVTLPLIASPVRIEVSGSGVPRRRL
jgi:hypothetical protein